MGRLPFLTKGHDGIVSFRDINEIINVVDREATKEDPFVPADDEAKAALFVAKILGRSNEDVPFNVILAWKEQFLTEAEIVPGTPPGDFEYFPGPRSSNPAATQVPGRISGAGGDEPGGPDNRFKEPAIYLMPPQGLMLHIPSEQGPTRQVWIPAPSVLHGKITTVHTGPPFNVAYSVESIDGSIVAFEITPIDRWDSTDYLPNAVDDPCLLLLTKQEFDSFGIPLPNQIPVSMVAWETPDFEQCAGGAAAAGGSLVGAGFTFGVTL